MLGNFPRKQQESSGCLIIDGSGGAGGDGAAQMRFDSGAVRPRSAGKAGEGRAKPAWSGVWILFPSRSRPRGAVPKSRGGMGTAQPGIPAGSFPPQISRECRWARSLLGSPPHFPRNSRIPQEKSLLPRDKDNDNSGIHPGIRKTPGSIPQPGQEFWARNAWKSGIDAAAASAGAFKARPSIICLYICIFMFTVYFFFPVAAGVWGEPFLP